MTAKQHQTVSLWIIATGIIIAGLYYGRAILAPFALAVFLFLIIEGFARSIDNSVRFIGRGISRALAIIGVLGGFIAFLILIAQSVGEVSNEQQINQIIRDGYQLFGFSNAPSLTELLLDQSGQFFSTVAGTLRGLINDLVLIFIYVAFLMLAQAAWPTKLDVIFQDKDARENIRRLGAQVRKSIEVYLRTQTLVSVLNTILTYLTLIILGVEAAVFLCALIFVLNYIPTIGSIVAAFIPPLFALVQPDIPQWIPAEAPLDRYIFCGLVLIAVSFWQFSIGNFLQPRMMGDTLNLSSLVVLIGLAVWGALWGIPGMFLSAPLTVLTMILLAQNSETYWIAVLLSGNGKPALLDSVPTEQKGA